MPMKAWPPSMGQLIWHKVTRVEPWRSGFVGGVRHWMRVLRENDTSRYTLGKGAIIAVRIFSLTISTRCTKTRAFDRNMLTRSC